VKEHDGLPKLIGPDGNGAYESTSSRLGWLGYQELHDALELDRDPAFAAAWATMQGKLQPDTKDYRVAEAAFDSEISPESLAEASHFRDLFPGYAIEQNKGSYSVKDGSETIAKIIPRRDLVFVGIRESRNPRAWFRESLEEVNVQGVRFYGRWIPVDRSDDERLAELVSGLRRPRAVNQDGL
jgi:hypothetical protein